MKRPYKKLGPRFIETILTTNTSEPFSTFQIQSSHYYYYHQKVADPTFHPLPWGKHKNRPNRIFSEVELPTVLQYFIEFISKNESTNLKGITEELKQHFNRTMSTEYVRKLIVSWNWSWKIPSSVQINKYTPNNIQRYINFIYYLKNIDIARLKFVDESHLIPKDFRNSKVLSFKGQRAWIPVADLHQKHASITLLTTLDNTKGSPIFFDWRTESNNSANFTNFIVSAIAAGYINNNDILLMDNATIHRDSENFVEFVEFLNTLGIEIVYLPTYSPEFNPCELVFNWLKNRMWKVEQKTIFEKFLNTATDLTFELMFEFYWNCCIYENIKNRINMDYF